MIHSIRDLIINLTFVLLPLFLTQVFWLDRPNRKTIPKAWHIGLFGGITALLCMSVPFPVSEGFFLDLRQVPLISSLLYGGWGSGLLTAAIMLAYRIYLGGSGIPGTFLATALVLAGYYVVSKWYRDWPSSTRIIASVVLSLWGLCSIDLGAYFFRTELFLTLTYQKFILQFAVIQSICMWITTYFLELMIRNNAVRDMLEQSKKMKLVSELAASVSHEVRNPLTVTRGFIQLLRKDDIPADKRSGFIELALQELDRAESIISDYLSFAKPQTGPVDTLNISEEIRYVSDVISPYATMNQVVIQLDVIGENRIRGEKEKFRQCIINLAKNAVEAMPEGGTLHFMVQRSGSKTIIRLQDTGLGMTQDQIERLGTPYYSTKEKGTGLGTMVVYSIIKAMGGKIEVESTIDAGTCFTLILPCVLEMSKKGDFRS
jgi:two-component system, sporulation sensor kinase B